MITSEDLRRKAQQLKAQQQKSSEEDQEEKGGVTSDSLRARAKQLVTSRSGQTTQPKNSTTVTSDDLRKGAAQLIQSRQEKEQDRASKRNRDYEYVSSSLGTIDEYLKTAGDAYGKLSYQNYKTSTDVQLQRASYIQGQIADLDRYLQQNRDSFDQDYASKLTDHLKSAETYRRNMVEAYTGAADYYGSITPEQVQQAEWMEKYQGKTKGEIATELTQKGLWNLAAGDEETKWLKKVYLPYLEEQEYLTADISVLQSELDDISRKQGEIYAEWGEWDPTMGSADRNQALDPEAQSAYYRKAEEVQTALAELEKERSEKQAYLNTALRKQENAKLAGVADPNAENYDPDFAQYTGYQSTALDGLWEKATSNYGLGYGDEVYEYINGNSDLRKKIATQSKTVAHAFLTPGTDIDLGELWADLSHMTADQIAIYNYHYAKNGKETADRYLESIRESLAYQTAEASFADIKGKPGLEYLFGAYAGVDQFTSGVANLFNTDDSYIPTSSTQMLSGMVRKDLKDTGPKLPDWMGGGSLGQAGYDLVTTSANMAPSILASTAIGAINPYAGAAVGNALMGGSAAGNAYQEALNLGYEKSQARSYSTMVGASEVALQYVLGGLPSLGGVATKNLTRMLDSVDHLFFRVAGKLGANMLSEGAEEALQEILTPFFKEAALHLEEDVDWDQVVYSGLLGALTPLFLEGGSITRNTVQEYNTAKMIGSDYSAADIQAFIQEGLDSKPNTEAYKLATEMQQLVNSGKTPTKYELARLYQANAQAIQAEQEAAPAQESAEPVQQPARAPQTGEAAVGSPVFPYKTKPASAPHKTVEAVAGSPVMPSKTNRSAVEDETNIAIKNYRKVYDAGFMNASNEDLDVPGMTIEQKVAAWEAGKTARDSAFTPGQNTAFVKYGNPGVVESPEALDFGKENPEAYKQANATAKAFGVKIKMGHYGDTFNGKIQNGVVFLNLDRINQKAQKSGKTVKRVMAEVIAHEITHRMQQTDAKAYVEYRDAALQAVASAKDLEAMIDSYKATVHEAIEKQKAEGNTPEMHELTDEEAMDEIVADFTADFIENTDKFSQFVSQSEEHRTVGKKILDFLKKVIADIKARFKTQSARDLAAANKFGFKLTDLEEAAKKWEAAWKASEKAVKNAPVQESTGDEAARYSIEVIDGRYIPVIDTHNDTRKYAAAEEYLQALVNSENPFATILSDAQPVYIGEDLPGEYRSSEYTKAMFPSLRDVKMQAATNLDEMLLLAEHGEWEENVKEKHNKDAKNGWYRYPTEFAVPIWNAKKEIDHYTLYSATLLIRNDADGKSYLYDLVNLEEKKKVISPASSTASGKQSEVKWPKPSFKERVSQPAPKVKHSVAGTESLLHKATDKQLDRRYAEAVKSHDSRTARAAVAEKARRWGAILDKDGKPKHFYHGTSQGGFTEFDAYGHGKFGLFGIGNYFTENYDVAASYMEKGNGTQPEIYSVYLKADNPIDMDANADISKWQAAAEDVDFTGCKTNEDCFVAMKEYCEDNWMVRWEAEELIMETIRGMGYDGITHIGGGRYKRNSGPKHQVVITFEPEQARSALEMTYDNDGKLIPLSERFSDKPDYRYSLAGTEDLLHTAQLKAIKDARNTYGTIKPGEKPAREAFVPKAMEKGKNVSLTIRTALEAGATPDAIVPKIADGIIKGQFSDEVHSNKDTLSKAKAWIEAYPNPDRALADWRDKIKDGRNLDESDTVKGYLLYNLLATRAAEAKTTWGMERYSEDAIDVLTSVANLTRTNARMVQATRLLKKLTPAGQYFSLERAVERLNQQIADDTAGIKLEKGRTKLEIDQELAAKWLQALHDGDTRAAADYEEQLYQSIARQVKRTFMDRWNAWRYLSMLGNVKTLTRNLVGNVFMSGAKFVKDKVAAIIESKFVSQDQRTKYFGSTHTERGKPIREFASKDYENVQRLLRSDNKYNDYSGPKLAEAIREYKSKFQMHGFKEWQQAVDWAMNGDIIGDSHFMRKHYTNSFAQIAMARGWTAEQIKSGAIPQAQLDVARAMAFKEAQKATFRDINAFSGTIRNLKFRGNSRSAKVGNIILEGNLPFKGTPANVLVRAVEYSPLELLYNATVGTWDVYHGKISASEYIDRFASGITGSAIFALGAFLAGMGLVSGGDQDDDEKRIGQQKYSLNIGGKSFSLDWLSPVSIPFFMGVECYNFIFEPIINGKPVDLGSAMTAISRSFQPLLEMSCLSSLNSLLDTMTYSDGADAGQLIYSFFVSPLISYVGQGIPTLLSQTANTLEKQGEKTFVSDIDNQFTRNITYDLVKLAEKIPFVDWRQVPRVDAWGRVDEGNGWAENYFSPAYINDVKVTEADKEIERLQGVFQSQVDALEIKLSKAKNWQEKKALQNQITDLKGLMNISPDGASTKIQGIRLSQQEYIDYTMAKTTANYELATELMASDWYKGLSDEHKSDAISKVYELADAKGQYAAVGRIKNDWTSGALELSNEEAIETAKAKLEDSWKNGSKNGAPSSYLSGAMTDGEAMDYLKNSAGFTAAEAVDRVTYWKFQKENPGSALSESAALAYVRSVSSYGVSLSAYESVVAYKSSHGGLKVATMDYIHTLPLSKNQKDAIYYALGWSAKTISDAPWH